MGSNRTIQSVDAMPIKLYYRQYSKSEDEDKVEPIETAYRTTDTATLNYLKHHDPSIPYPINTVHLQNPYKHPLKFEGYATGEIFKVRPASFKIMYRSKDTALRSRYNKNKFIKKESPLTQHYDYDDDKSIRFNKNENQRWTKLTNIMKQYCMNSTLHGLRYVGDSSLSIVERIFWIISFTLAVLTAAYYIWLLYQRWVSTPIIIALSPESVSLDQFPFPSVTICNMNNVKKSEANRIIAGNDVRKKQLLDDKCNIENSSAHNVNENMITWDNIFHFMVNVSQSCTEMLHLCKWYGNITDCEKIFNPTLTDEGMCCNFNSVERKYLFYNPRDWSDINVTFPFNNSIDWNPETGYGEDVSPDSIPWRPYGAGQFYGLTLVLDVNMDEYYCSSTASVGFKMLLHNPVETPKIAEFAFTVTPGEETRVIVAPRISAASKSIINIPLRKRKCFFTSERKLRYYRTYTQRNCVLECEANFTQKLCHCVQYYMPKSSNTQICEKKDDKCATSARRAMEVKLYDDDMRIGSLNVSETPSCNCYPGCFEIGYNVEISQSKLVPTFIIPDTYVKKNKDYFAKNMAVVHLFFVDSQFTKYMKNELFGFTEFLSSTGGLLGLFMGFSFLSLVEIVYFVTLRLWCRVYKSRHAPRDNILHVQPFDSSTNLVYPFVQ